jgi:hypothetical protein
MTERIVIMSPDELREKLSDRRTAVVAERTDMTYMTIHRLMQGQKTSLKTMQKLTEYFEQHP